MLSSPVVPQSKCQSVNEMFCCFNELSYSPLWEWIQNVETFRWFVRWSAFSPQSANGPANPVHIIYLVKLCQKSIPTAGPLSEHRHFKKKWIPHSITTASLKEEPDLCNKASFMSPAQGDEVLWGSFVNLISEPFSDFGVEKYLLVLLSYRTQGWEVFARVALRRRANNGVPDVLREELLCGSGWGEVGVCCRAPGQPGRQENILIHLMSIQSLVCTHLFEPI